MANELTFTIQPDAESVSLRLFGRAIYDIERLIRDVDYAVTHESSPRRWIISGLHSTAPTINIRPVLDETQSVDVIANGLALVNAGTNEPPDYFTEAALDDLKRMSDLFSGRDRARSILVPADGQLAHPTTIRRDIREKANRILSEGYSNLGSIEGNLEAVNLHGPATFTIWDRVSLAPVRCYFAKDSAWTDRVKDFLTKRALVRGTVQYFRNGVPRSITNIVEILDYTPDQRLPVATFGSIPDGAVSTWLAAKGEE